jgi:4-amino-4-deoxy-L-arabinose transferase-like glycosyltransferase
MRRDYILLTLIGFLLFVPGLGLVHLFDWDEINFAESAREMLVTGDWFRPQIDFEPFWEKPPLFLWMQAAAMSLFGVNEFSARLPNAICGIATLLLVYNIGFRLHDRMFGWIWALAWVGSILPHLYFRSGIIDPWFNLFIFCGLYGFIEFRWQFFTQKTRISWWHKYRYLVMGGLLLGLAIMTKGPAAFLIVMLVLGGYWVKYRFRGKGYFKHMVIYALFSGVAGTLWFVIESIKFGPWFAVEFFEYQIRLFNTPDSGHGGFWGYHFVVLLLGCFPVSVFALFNLWGDRVSEDEMLESGTLEGCKRSDLGTWMQLLFWVVLILFSIVKTKIVHYSSLAYFPITYLGAVTLWRAICWDARPKWIPYLLPLIGIIIGGLVAVLPWFGQHIEWIRPMFHRDPFAAANLEAIVDWQLWHGLPGLVLIAASVMGSYYWIKYRHWLSVQTVFVGGAVFTSMTLLLIVNKIESYTQRAAIEFYMSKSGEDCFVKPIGYKSYAHLFYTEKPYLPDPKMDEYDNLAHGHTHKKVYFVAKLNRLEELPTLPKCHELYRKNGFVFFERDAR